MYNLIIITPDQLRQDFLSCYGHPTIQTQHIDKLSYLGVTFDNCYCAAPLCAPSRVSFATSTYLSEHNHRNYGSTISPDVPNIVTALKSNGYTTGMFGKNHLFTYERLSELWDEMDEINLGNYDGHPDYQHSYSSFTMADNHPFNITKDLTDKGIRFIEHHQTKPFFLWLNYQDPHPAFTCPKPYDTMFSPDEIVLPESYYHYNPEQEPARNQSWRIHSEMDCCSEDEMKSAVAHYMGQIRYVDDNLGRLLVYLQKQNLLENTIILFFSDHGELLGNHHMVHKLPVFYDCLTKIPVILYHPRNYHGVRFSGLVEEIDLAPTLLDLLGIEIPPTMVGTSLKSTLDTGSYDIFKSTILCEAGGGAPTCKKPIQNLTLVAPFPPTSFGPGAMLRKGDYKLSIYGDDLCELYDLAKDPEELQNLFYSNSFQEIRNDLLFELLRRILNTKVRSLKTFSWSYTSYPLDVRFEPLEGCCKGSPEGAYISS